MTVTWENAKDLSTSALRELVEEGLHKMNFLEARPELFLEAHAALFELTARALRGEVWREELDRRRHAA